MLVSQLMAKHCADVAHQACAPAPQTKVWAAQSWAWSLQALPTSVGAPQTSVTPSQVFLGSHLELSTATFFFGVTVPIHFGPLWGFWLGGKQNIVFKPLY